MKKKTHMEVQIRNDAGEMVPAIAPVIISASRSTDIPAFYADWFCTRLKRGYCTWENPFNRKKMYVSFKNCRVVVFWTKNPAPLLAHLHMLDAMNINYYFQFTLNDYEEEGLEPNVPSLRARLETFRQLSEMIGPERVIWRFDPLLMLPGKTTQDLIARVERVGELLRGCTQKLVFSFIDVRNYQKVQRNMVNELNAFSSLTVHNAEPDTHQQEEIAEGLAGLRDAWHRSGWEISLATCAEKIDFARFGIAHNHCIDGMLMKKVFSADKALLGYLQTGSLRNIFESLLADVHSLKIGKDKGQRPECGCIESKDIGSYNTCRHFCVYCYANTSRKSVQKRIMHIDPTRESIA